MRIFHWRICLKVDVKVWKRKLISIKWSINLWRKNWSRMERSLCCSLDGSFLVGWYKIVFKISATKHIWWDLIKKEILFIHLALIFHQQVLHFLWKQVLQVSIRKGVENMNIICSPDDLLGLFRVFELLPLAVTSLIPVVLLPMMGIVSTEEISHFYMKVVFVIKTGW